MKPFAHQSSKINLSTVLLIFWFCTVLRCSVTCGRQLAVRISSNAMPRFFLPKLKFNKFNINLVWMAGMAGMWLIPQPWPVDRIGARAHGTQPPCRIHRNPSVLDSQETVQMVGLHQWFRTWCWTHSNSLIRLILKRRKDTKAQSSVFMVRNTLGMDSLRVLRYTTGLGKMFICMLDKPIVVKLATRWVFPWYLTHGKSRKPDRWSKKKRRENFFRKKGRKPKDRLLLFSKSAHESQLQLSRLQANLLSWQRSKRRNFKNLWRADEWDCRAVGVVDALTFWPCTKALCLRFTAVLCWERTIAEGNKKVCVQEVTWFHQRRNPWLPSSDNDMIW